MTRCLTCNGILAKNERVCYSCGEAAPIHTRSSGYSLLLALAFIVSLGLTAFSFLSGR
jgi:hypothetical protein